MRERALCSTIRYYLIDAKGRTNTLGRGPEVKRSVSHVRPYPMRFETRDVQIHHIDGNDANNSEPNLTVKRRRGELGPSASPAKEDWIQFEIPRITYELS
jgi:hypothetical protein